MRKRMLNSDQKMLNLHIFGQNTHIVGHIAHKFECQCAQIQVKMLKSMLKSDHKILSLDFDKNVYNILQILMKCAKIRVKMRT